MKYFTLFLYLSLSIGATPWGSEAFIADNIGVVDDIGKQVFQVTDMEGSATLNQRRSYRKLKVGDSFFETTYLETQGKSLVTLMLPDNSIVYLGPNTVLKINELSTNSKKMKITFYLIKGVMRMVSYKGNHTVRSPTGALAFGAADLEWDVYQSEHGVNTDIKKYSGHVINQDEDIQELLATERPEMNKLGIDSLSEPWERWFGDIDQGHDYSFAYHPRFDSKSKEGRRIASIKEKTKSTTSLMSELENKTYNYPKVDKKIFIHENFFDYVLINVQKAAQIKAKEIVRSAYKTAGMEMVGEVASHSLNQWGTLYAQRAAFDEIPTYLKGMFREVEERNIMLNDLAQTSLYVDSAERIALSKSYLTAKSTLKNEGVKKAIRETQSYIMALIPKIITSPLEYEVYKYTKENSSVAANSFLKKSVLVKSKDVGNLIEYLSQIAAKRFTMLEIIRIEKETSYKVAEAFVLDAFSKGANKMASVIAGKVSKRTAELFNKMLDHEVAYRGARKMASENQTQLGADYEISKQVQSAD